MTTPAAARLAVIGAGPRGVGFLERLAASLPELAPTQRLEVHLVDPYSPGPGRIWRYAQSSLLKLNSLAEDVTMFTDTSSTITGPVTGGPSLIEWAEGVRSGLIGDVVIRDPALRRELAALLPKSFPTRRLQSVYLDWFFRRTLERLGTDPSRVAVHVHRASAMRVEERESATGEPFQAVTLSTGAEIAADVVLYSVGHTGREPEPEHVRLLDFAYRRELYYLPPAFTADADTRPIVPGQRVIVRGFGLAAIDLVVLLTEGRGGRFERDDAGQLVYRASGKEPRLVIGSGRGVPYRSKIETTLLAPRSAARYFDASIAEALVRDRVSLDFHDDVWPLIAKELLLGYYAELFRGHPDRVALPWGVFLAVLDENDWDSERLRETIDRAVIDPLDRLHLREFDRPLDGRDLGDFTELQTAVRRHITDDLALRTRQEHSATLGLFHAALAVVHPLTRIANVPSWTARSRLHDLHKGWLDYFSYIASGPPAHRLEELLALSTAGVVEFLGNGMTVVADEREGVFRAKGASSPYEVRASALVEARLPRQSVSESDNPVLSSLVESGIGCEEYVDDAFTPGSTGRLLVSQIDTRIVRADGTTHPRRYAIGPYTNSPFAGAFARPRTDAVSFRENDGAARAILRTLAEIADERTAAARLSEERDSLIGSSAR